jgi:pimeloyl-ACP methyl ester carboxylesterase
LAGHQSTSIANPLKYRYSIGENPVQHNIRILRSGFMITVPTYEVTLKDARRLSYAEYGDGEGTPVILLHGMPGSRILGRIFDDVARQRGLRVIAPERPGYGFSSPVPMARLEDYPNDITELSEILGLRRFIIMGVSGGGPAALACASMISDQLIATALVSG